MVPFLCWVRLDTAIGFCLEGLCGQHLYRYVFQDGICFSCSYCDCGIYSQLHAHVIARFFPRPSVSEATNEGPLWKGCYAGGKQLVQSWFATGHWALCPGCYQDTTWYQRRSLLWHVCTVAWWEERLWEAPQDMVQCIRGCWDQLWQWSTTGDYYSLELIINVLSSCSRNTCISCILLNVSAFTDQKSNTVIWDVWLLCFVCSWQRPLWSKCRTITIYTVLREMLDNHQWHDYYTVIAIVNLIKLFIVSYTILARWDYSFTNVTPQLFPRQPLALGCVPWLPLAGLTQKWPSATELAPEHSWGRWWK